MAKTPIEEINHLSLMNDNVHLNVIKDFFYFTLDIIQ